jgi:signal transduction histidine kinase
MKVKDRLSLQFTFMFAVLLLVVLSGIYWVVNNNREKAFYNKLNDRAVTVAQFYLAEDNLSKENFEKVLKKFPQSLYQENIKVYNDSFRPQFIPEDSVHWDTTTLKSVIAQKVIDFSQGDRQVGGIYYVDNSGNFIIMVSAIDDGGQQQMSGLRLIMLFFFGVSLGITFITGRVFSRISLSPIIRMTNNLKAIRATSLDLRLPVDEKKTDEIDSLSLTINQLLEHLEQSFESQRSFIAHASHELRTPVTTILGEAEIGLMQDRQKDDYKLILKNIIKETERLSHIINSLMDLIQTNMSGHDVENIRMDELLWEIMDELPGCKVQLSYPVTGNRERYIIQGNRQLLFIGICNILKNAVKFSNNKPVECSLFYDAKGVHVVLKDEGIGIEEKDLQNIFQPFFRSNNGLNYPGYGIGLSLTQNIVRLHNGIIKVTSTLNKGSEFHLVFPAI